MTLDRNLSQGSAFRSLKYPLVWLVSMKILCLFYILLREAQSKSSKSSTLSSHSVWTTQGNSWELSSLLQYIPHVLSSPHNNSISQMRKLIFRKSEQLASNGQKELKTQIQLVVKPVFCLLLTLPFWHYYSSWNYPIL